MAFALSLSLFAKTPLPGPGLKAAALVPLGIETNGWFRLGIQRPEAVAYRIERSEDLIHWKEVAVLHGPEWEQREVLPFADAARTGAASFYRVTAEPLSFDSDWRNQIYYPDDPFRSESISFGLPETRWIKFAIVTSEPTRVYYQNSWKYKFHYDFARARLDEFKGMTPSQFDAVSLYTNAQKVVLGAVLFSPRQEMREAAIQFVGQDAYRPEQVAAWFDLVRSTILPLDGLKVSYMPAYEQAGVAEGNRAFLEARGIQVSSLGNWDTGESCYSPGWAIGRLKFVPASQLVEAYSNGQLTPDDILLIDAVPAEVPFVRGIISLAPSTPNSHVAILARSYQVPFAWFASPELQQLAQASIGKEVIFTAYLGFAGADLRVLDAAALDPTLKDQILAEKEAPPLNITPKARFGAYTASTDELTPADIKYFGGKASNFGFLRRQIPSNSPPAIAISFDLWDDYMDQRLPGGVTLRTAISNRLSQYVYPPNLELLRRDLDEIRRLIEDEGVFTENQQQQIAAALLARFDPQTRIRFRSSTNVEDTDQFVGAGLYDSYSGCLADDQDNDSSGPSICNPAEPKERGVFRAIRKVYASFYNENAVLERMRWGVDETKVGMAVLVHYSAPDETEMANGVATVAFERRAPTPRQPGGQRSYVAEMVTQKGAVSVTNPDGTAQPEVVRILFSGFNPYREVRQWSSLVPFGATVLASEAEYFAFAEFFTKVADAFEGYYPGKTNYTLDFEYKKLVPGVLSVKQVRQLPTAAPGTTNQTYLINHPGIWEVFQGEYGDVVANHRLKARFDLTTRDIRLTRGNLDSPVLGPITVTYLGTNVFSGAPSSFPEARHTVAPEDHFGTPVTDSWRMEDKIVSLTTFLRTTARPTESPFVTLQDARVIWRADYATPLPSVGWDSQMTTVTNEEVMLQPVRQTNEGSILVTRTIPAGAGAAVTTQFYWPPYPVGPTVGYTAPLQKWVETRIEGLTTEPIVLRDYFSQTYRPEHHNFGEFFIFEPALEPGISPAVLAELEAKNIRYIYVHWDGSGGDRNFIHVAGEDWQFRPLVPRP